MGISMGKMGQCACCLVHSLIKVLGEGQCLKGRVPCGFFHCLPVQQLCEMCALYMVAAQTSLHRRVSCQQLSLHRENFYAAPGAKVLSGMPSTACLGLFLKVCVVAQGDAFVNQ